MPSVLILNGPNLNLRLPGGGPYVVEAAYDLGDRAAGEEPEPGYDEELAIAFGVED